MGDFVTLDVIDRPRGGVVRALRAGHRARGVWPGLRAVLPLGTAAFSRHPVPAVTPHRMGVLAVWAEAGDARSSWEASFGALAAGSREHWHVAGEVARAHFTEPWGEWTPEVAGAAELHDDEPALILISGDLHARYFPAFVRDGARAFGHADGHPGYLGGLGLATSLLNTTSCSAWRSYSDAKAYAYRPGPHRDAMRRDVAAGHHRTQWFLRIRPVAERGTLRGRAPLAGVLDRTRDAG